MVDLASLNPFASIGINKIGMVLLVAGISITLCIFFGLGLFLFLQRKQLRHIIPLYRMVGARPIKVGTYKAKDFAISMAGDKLWYIPKIKKYLPCGTIQTAPNEYPHFEREDGEWINFGLGDIDQQMKLAGVKYINQDMRSQRIAISEMLESRFKDKKTWWDKYGAMVTQVIFYIIVMVALVVVFYQWGGIIEGTNALFDKIVAYENMKCPNANGVVPALAFFLIKPFRKFRR